MEELLKQLLQAELAKAQGGSNEPVAKAATPEQTTPTAPAFDTDALVSRLSDSLLPKVEEMVQKAMPAPAREQGTGSAAVVAKGGNENPVAELIAKAKKPSELTQDEKNAIWALTKHALGQGLTMTNEA